MKGDDMSRMIAHRDSRLFSRIALLGGILAVLLLAGCYYGPYGYYSTGTLAVSSPTVSVYTAAPSLTYTASRDVSVTLNGTLVTTVSGGTLGNAVTGLNELVVSELSSTGSAVTSKTITFFVNDLSASDSENWTTDYSDWASFRSTDGSVNFYHADTLAVHGASTTSAWGAMKKTYSSGTETECIQAQDVLLIENSNSYAAVGFLTDSREMLAAKLVKTGASAYDLYITEVSTCLPSPYSFDVGKATLSAVTSGSTIRVYFYRNGTAYQAAAADSSGNILASVASAASYAPVITPGYRGVILAPYDAAGNTAKMVEVDNYAYYK
jgi:hypothetical protein